MLVIYTVREEEEEYVPMVHAAIYHGEIYVSMIRAVPSKWGKRVPMIHAV